MSCTLSSLEIYLSILFHRDGDGASPTTQSASGASLHGEVCTFHSAGHGGCWDRPQCGAEQRGSGRGELWVGTRGVLRAPCVSPRHTVSAEKPRAGRARGGQGSFPGQQAGSSPARFPSRQMELTGEAGSESHPRYPPAAKARAQPVLCSQGTSWCEMEELACKGQGSAVTTLFQEAARRSRLLLAAPPRRKPHAGD